MLIRHGVNPFVSRRRDAVVLLLRTLRHRSLVVPQAHASRRSKVLPALSLSRWRHSDETHLPTKAISASKCTERDRRDAFDCPTALGIQVEGLARSAAMEPVSVEQLSELLASHPPLAKDWAEVEVPLDRLSPAWVEMKTILNDLTLVLEG